MDESTVRQKLRAYIIRELIRDPNYVLTDTEGIVSGGGVALVNAIAAIDKVEAEGDELTGVNLVKKALEEPLRQIANNAGVEGSVVVEKVKEAAPGIGYNALTGAYENLVEAGIIDPAKVTRSALQNAASIAYMLLTTEAVVSEIPNKDEMKAMAAQEEQQAQQLAMQQQALQQGAGQEQAVQAVQQSQGII